MSMTKEMFINHIEDNDFDAVLNEVNKPDSKLSVKLFQSWFRDGYLSSTHPYTWIQFLVHLNKTNQNKFKTPNYLVDLFAVVIDSVKPKLKTEIEFNEETSLFETFEDIEESEEDKKVYHTNIAQCSPLLNYILTQLTTLPNNNLLNNHLPLFEYLLISYDLHKDVLNIIEQMEAPNKNHAYNAIFVLYQLNPNLLYDAANINPKIFKLIGNALQEPQKIFFITQMETLIQTNNKPAIYMICSFLKDRNNNEINRNLAKHLNQTDLIELNMITSQADSVINKLKDLFKSDTGLLTKLEKFIASYDKITILNFTNQLFPFLNGFNRLDINDGLLTCAQISSRKKYKFDPIILEDNDEFSNFLKMIKNDNAARKIKFAITGEHWIAGEIQTDEDGNAKIAIYDSLGTSEKQKMHFLQSTTLAAMEIFNNVFHRNPIYFCTTKRQHASQSCSIFALDDLIHLFTVENYLKKNIFDYYDAQPKIIPQVTIQNTKKLNLHLCTLPLSLFRTTQSLTTINHLKEKADMSFFDKPINKKRKNLLIS